MPKLFQRLALLTAALAFCLMALGAYVRLSDAGLSCPDWPGCYGHFVSVPTTPAEQAVANAAFPNQPVESDKAWKEMAHRYLAGFVGLLIVALVVLTWKTANPQIRSLRVLGLSVLVVVVLQALLGMWTVSLRLRPLIVTAHLLGGMATFALLLTLALRSFAPQTIAVTSALRCFARLVLGVVVLQIALGGWVSSNYAALACGGFPSCLGSFNPVADYAAGFSLWRELGQTSTGGYLPLTALTAIHWVHRIGALMVTLAIVTLVVFLLRRRPREGGQGEALALLVVLFFQIAIGVANVEWSRPLPLAVLHNMVAAILLTQLLLLNLRLTLTHQQAV